MSSAAAKRRSWIGQLMDYFIPDTPSMARGTPPVTPPSSAPPAIPGSKASTDTHAGADGDSVRSAPAAPARYGSRSGAPTDSRLHGAPSKSSTCASNAPTLVPPLPSISIPQHSCLPAAAQHAAPCASSTTMTIPRHSCLPTHNPLIPFSDRSSAASSLPELVRPEPVVPATASSSVPQTNDPTRKERATLPLPSGLFPHQRTGVEWLMEIYQKRTGGILADDMGLGKTVQVATFLACARARAVLLVVPVSLIGTWQKELAKWCPALRVFVLHGSQSRKRKARDMGSSGVLITTYETLGTTIDDIAQFTVTAGPKEKKTRVDDDEFEAWVDPFQDEPLEIGHTFPWDVIIFDEAQRLKNPSTLIGKASHQVKARTRLALSGTPIQNNLIDLWSVMDICVPSLLGNLRRFRLNFADAIDRGSLKSAASYDVDLKNVLSQQLRNLLAPYLLRRTKDEVNLLKDVKKAEIVLWLRPSKTQTDIYRHVINQSMDIKAASDSKSMGLEVFRAVNLLKKICNTPMLAHPNAHNWEDLVGHASQENGVVSSDEDPLASSEEVVDVIKDMIKELSTDKDELVAQSAKLQCLLDLIPQLRSKGHRIVIFSASTKMCDLISVTVLRPLKVKFLRIDGTFDQQMRERKISDFQSNSTYTVFLSSTQVGGVGLTLHSADRVILVDPAWNPATDAQAVDRVFRIGQLRSVVAYRLIVSGMIEEKMFRLQVFKMSIAHAMLGSSAKATRYFSKKDIRALFEMDPPELLATKKRMVEKHGEGVEELDRLFKGDIDDVSDMPWFLGISDFSKLFSSIDDEMAEEPVVDDQADIKELLEVLSRKLFEAAQQRELKQTQLDEAKKKWDDSEEQQKKITRDHRNALEQMERVKKEKHTSKKRFDEEHASLDKREREFQKADKALTQYEKQCEQRKQALHVMKNKVAQAVEAVTQCECEFRRIVDDLPPNISDQLRFTKAVKGAESSQVHLEENPGSEKAYCDAEEATKRLQLEIVHLTSHTRVPKLMLAFQAMCRAQVRGHEMRTKFAEAEKNFEQEEKHLQVLQATHAEYLRLRDAAALSAASARKEHVTKLQELMTTDKECEQLKVKQKATKRTADDMKKSYGDRRKSLIFCKKQEMDAVKGRKSKEDEFEKIRRKLTVVEHAKRSNLDELRSENYEVYQADRMAKRRKKEPRHSSAASVASSMAD
eukprot:GEMP01004163.1.p1 GENE.GEMP01004163.1~~GEMP01004163.1.p1  ORF type:complete len:1212 (+),score=283.67 GEMP01004163.1:72-3638(+)